MRKIFVYSSAVLLLLSLSVSCKKEQQANSIIPVQADQYVNASVTSGETFTFVAGSTGSLSVSKQALHFQVSQALNEKGSVYYNYKPAAGYIGPDEVALMYVKDAAAAPGINSTECPANHSAPASNGMSTIVIKLSVTK